MTSVVQSSYSTSVSRSNITIIRLTVLVGFNASIIFYNVDFRVIFLVVGLKVGLSVNLISESAFKSMFDLGVGEVVELVIRFAVASSALLKMTFRLVRTILLIRSYSLKMVVVSYPISYSFSDRDVILPSCLICGLSAYAAHSKVLICL
jgi:hypothetical protein